jgi:alpha-galactosidase
MVEKSGAPIRLRRFVERVEAQHGADAVITVLDVGGRRAWSADVQIQRKYGIYVPVADTTTPGGFARSLRTIPTLVAIAHDMERLCPKAILLNYCNPMAAIVRAITRESGIEVYGLCHGVPAATRYLAQFLDVPPDECEGTAVGFNHFLWFLEFKLRGRDAFPLIAAKNCELIAAGKPPGNDPDAPLAWDLFEAFGYFPLSRDRHITEFFPHLHPRGEHYGKILGVDRFCFERWVVDMDATFERMRAMAHGESPIPDTLFHAKVGEREFALNILRALEERAPKTFHVTIPNRDQVENLRQGLCIESPVEFSSKGVKPRPLGAIPEGVRASVEKAFLTAELIVDAALQRDRRKFVQAIIIDGWIPSVKQAGELADELIQAHRQYLPGW